MKKGRPAPAEAAFTDNWPIPFFRVHPKNTPSRCTLNGPVRLHRCDWLPLQTAPHSKSRGRTRGMSDLSPSSSSLLRSIVCSGPFIKGLASHWWLVMEVKMSSGYQSGSITTFKAYKSTYTTQRSPNPLKAPACFILQARGMDVVLSTPPYPGSTQKDCDWWTTSLSPLHRLPAASGCDNPSVGRRDGTGARLPHFLKCVTD